MRFMVEIDAGMEKANAIDASGGPGAMLAKLGERFKPEAVYGKALYCRRSEITGRHFRANVRPDMGHGWRAEIHADPDRKL